MKLIATISKKEVFDINVNGVTLKDFVKDSEWEGLVCLKNSVGSIIAHKPSVDFSDIVNLGSTSSKPLEIISISPDLIPVPAKHPPIDTRKTGDEW